MGKLLCKILQARKILYENAVQIFVPTFYTHLNPPGWKVVSTVMYLATAISSQIGCHGQAEGSFSLPSPPPLRTIIITDNNWLRHCLSVPLRYVAERPLCELRILIAQCAPNVPPHLLLAFLTDF